METQHLQVTGGTIAYDDSNGTGPLVLMIPGAGDIRQEYRFMAPRLVNAGFRVVTMDLRGHGESSPDWEAYTMADTAADLVALLEHLGAGPASIVATSFAPAAVLWAVADRPELVDRIVLISAHLEAAPAWQAAPLKLALRGPFAGSIWASQFRKWHPASPPADLDQHARALATMMSDPKRRRAVRETLTAHRNGLEQRIDRVDAPTLVVMGGADSHFGDPPAEGESIASSTGGTVHIVERAGHYPHVEFPDDVASAITSFLATTS
ncbi:MAG: alpha/beta hydrolase [Acidimicrobiia bacterium]|nr:alpha/beta hydrolase [Acidimicrobiia bacterium]MDH4309645.1 alpha/beta hydrolase [Acidimicrobiia bacterium]MDH5295101.1 alpha/beta hydrolase [Acidimicrobiia bacterium]